MTQDCTQPDWRPLLAVLANPYARRVFAEIVLGVDTERLGEGLGRARRRPTLPHRAR